MIPVNKRGGFSDRNGIKPLNTEIQLKDFDEHTRVELFNSIALYFGIMYKNSDSPRIQHFFRYVLEKLYMKTKDFGLSYRKEEILEIIRETILKDDYDSVLTVVEAIVQYFYEYLKGTSGYKYNKKLPRIYEYFNGVFEEEYVGYRFIGGRISSISDKIEFEAVGEALDNEFKSVREHIFKANALLSDRKKPDYENSIKESISAVEAICQEILKIKGREATLGNMLKKFESNGIEIHKALKEAFEKLYGYTSNANGIRHAGDIGGSSSTFEEAKFMLVSCSAFINYLMSLQSKIKC